VSSRKSPKDNQISNKCRIFETRQISMTLLHHSIARRLFYRSHINHRTEWQKDFVPEHFRSDNVGPSDVFLQTLPKGLGLVWREMVMIRGRFDKVLRKGLVLMVRGHVVVGSMCESMIHTINDRINRFTSISSGHANLRKHTFLQTLSQTSQPPQSLEDTSDFDDCHITR
jgi:hypothetical protein